MPSPALPPPPPGVSAAAWTVLHVLGRPPGPALRQLKQALPETAGHINDRALAISATHWLCRTLAPRVLWRAGQRSMSQDTCVGDPIANIEDAEHVALEFDVISRTLRERSGPSEQTTLALAVLDAGHDAAHALIEAFDVPEDVRQASALEAVTHVAEAAHRCEPQLQAATELADLLCQWLARTP